MGDEDGTDRTITIRTPEPADGAGCGAAHALAWKVGYEGLLPEAFLDEIAPDRWGAGWTETLTRIERDGPGPDDPTTLLAQVDGEVAGVTSFGRYRTGGRTPIDGADQLCELWMINVHPEHWGTGVAQALMAAALDGLRSSRPEPTAALWVLEGNTRGRRFYDKVGWVADGVTKTDTVGGGDVVEVRYVITL